MDCFREGLFFCFTLFQFMELKELKDKLEVKLNKLYPTKIFLDKLRVIDEDSRKTSPYCDPKYIPVYYWLGSMIESESVLEVGFRLGLFSSCFLKGCKTVKHFLGFQQTTDGFYSPNLGKSNIKDNFKGQMNVYVGNLGDDTMEELLKKNKFDMVIINEELNYDAHKSILDICWDHMSINGLLAMDYVVKHKPCSEAYYDFCKGKNRIPVVVDTRYGLGLIRK